MKHYIIGAGALGIHLFLQLKKAGQDVTIISRSNKQIFGSELDITVCDVANKAALMKLIEPSSIIYNALGMPYKEWDKFASLVDVLIDVAASSNSLFVYADNLYAYGKVPENFNEETPYHPVGFKTKLRHDVLNKVFTASKSGKIKMVIGASSDFYGPYVVNSSLCGDQIFGQVLKGKNAMAVGNMDVLHTYTYIEDFARALIVLANDASSYGQVWHVPTSDPVTFNQAMKTLSLVTGKDIKISSLKKPLFSLVSLFNPMVGELKEMYYMFSNPFTPSCEKFMNKYPDFKVTSLNDGLTNTWEWYCKTH